MTNIVLGGAIGKTTSTIQANKAKGKAFEDNTGTSLKGDHDNVEVVPEITVKTDKGTKTRIDFIAKDNQGGCKLVECKSSGTAPLTKNQQKAFPEIEQSGATVVGKGKGKGSFTNGTRIEPTKVEIIRPEN